MKNIPVFEIFMWAFTVTIISQYLTYIWIEFKNKLKKY